MDINDIVMISIYNYISYQEIDYTEMYGNLCNDIAIYIENNIVNDKLIISQERLKQFIIQFLSKELDIEKFIQYEQQIMDFIINDDILDYEKKSYNIKISHGIIKLYKNINQEKLILDIANKIKIRQK